VLNVLNSLRHAVENACRDHEKRMVRGLGGDNDLARFTTIHEISQHKVRSNQPSLEV
jgi:hypothetical protein